MSIVSNVCTDRVTVYHFCANLINDSADKLRFEFPVKSESISLPFASTSSLFDNYVSLCLEMKDYFAYLYKLKNNLFKLKNTVTMQIGAHCFLEISSRISFL